MKENPHSDPEHDSVVQRFDQLALLLVGVGDSIRYTPSLAYAHACDALKVLALLRAQVLK